VVDELFVALGVGFEEGYEVPDRAHGLGGDVMLDSLDIAPDDVLVVDAENPKKPCQGRVTELHRPPELLALVGENDPAVLLVGENPASTSFCTMRVTDGDCTSRRPAMSMTRAYPFSCTSW
jgi:hypothetical protein